MKISNKLLDDLFQDQMVLPAYKYFRVGGVAQPAAKVTVLFKGEKFTTKSDQEGKWSLTLAPVTDPYQTYDLTVKTANDEETIHHIHFGKVFLLSGQSNIEFRLKDEAGYKQVLADFDPDKNENLFYYNVPQIDYVDPETKEVKPADLQAEKWHRFAKDNLGQMSAVGYYLLKELQKSCDWPLAIVDDFKGGTSASAWVPVEKLTTDNELKQGFIDPWQQAVAGKTWADFEAETAAYNDQVKEHNDKLAGYLKQHPESTLSNAKNVVGHTPWPPPARPDLFTRPGGLYETMVSQVRYGTFNGMVWYQGENDTDRAEHYHKLLPLLIDTWRETLHDSSLPVYLVQLPGYADYPEDSAAMIRQVQRQTAGTIPHVHLVSFVDGGEKHNIHPTHKAKMGQRLGRIISQLSYASTPDVYQVVKTEEQLILKISSCQKLALKGEAVIKITEDGQSKEINLTAANLVKNTIQLPKCQHCTLSYGYSNFPEKIGLVNELGDPVSPFRIEID